MGKQKPKGAGKAQRGTDPPSDEGWPEVPTSRKLFRLENNELVYKLRMILEDANQSAASFIEPLIADEVRLRFAVLQQKLNRLKDGQDAGEAKRKAE